MPARLQRNSHVAIHLSLAAVLVAFSAMAVLERGGPSPAPSPPTRAQAARTRKPENGCELLDVFAEGPLVSRGRALSDGRCPAPCEFLDSFVEGPVVSRAATACDPAAP